jgi:2,5-diketo-D-gluconate reductase B
MNVTRYDINREDIEYIMLALGTYRLKPDVAADMVQKAIGLGVKCIDTAQLYGNERDMMDVVSKFPNVSLTTKIHRKLIKGSDRDNRAIENSIYGRPNIVLLHSPEKNFEIAWEQLKRVETKDISIGVSNFNVEQIKRLSTVPKVNQLELSPYNQSRETVAWCEEKGIGIQSHSSLTKGELIDETTVGAIAKKHSVDPAQVFLAWGLKKRYTVCFTTSDETHLAENMKAIGVDLSVGIWLSWMS